MKISNYKQLSNFVTVRYKEDRQTEQNLFFMAAPFTISFEIDHIPSKITLPHDFGTDFGSIPKLVPRWIAAPLDCPEGFTVHDYVYRTGCLPRNVGDLLLVAMMEEAKMPSVPWWRRKLIYRGVRLGGASSYRGKH